MSRFPMPSKKIVMAAVALKFVALGMVAYAPAALADDHDLSTLEIAAQVNIKQAPDIATVTAGVVTDAPTADAAMKDNATRMNAVFAALKKAGIADKDIQSAGININPQYNYVQNEPPKVTGYQASNTVTVHLRNMENIGPVLDALVAQGVNQMNGPTFSVEDSDAALDAARTEAVKKARKRADLYAAAAGLQVKRILSITEQANMGIQPPMPMMKAMSMEASNQATPVAPGEVELSVVVNVKYEIAP